MNKTELNMGEYLKLSVPRVQSAWFDRSLVMFLVSSRSTSAAGVFPGAYSFLTYLVKTSPNRYMESNDCATN